MKKLLIFLLLLASGFVYSQQVVIEDKKVNVGDNPLWLEGIGVDSANWTDEYKAVYYYWSEANRPHIDTADLQNDLVVAEIVNGDWATSDAFYVCANDNATIALTNWKDPGTYDLVNTGSATFVRYEGFQGNGSSMYLTSYNPGDGGGPYNFTQDDASAICYLRLNTGLGAYQYPFANGNLRIAGLGVDESVTAYRMNTGTNQTFTMHEGDYNGCIIITRRGSTDSEGWQNGVSGGTSSTASTGITNAAITVLRYTVTYSELQISVLIFKDATANTAAALSTSNNINAYMTGIGKNVY